MEKIYAVEGSRISLGRRDENLARCILFDISRWEALYGEGTVQLIHQRCGDEYPYPCAITVEDGKVEWEIGVADVALVGVGRAELQYFVGEQLVKSVVYTTETMQALDTTATVPPTAPEAGWVAQVLAAGTQAAVSAAEAEQSEEAAKDYAAEAKESAEASRENEEHTAQMKQDAEAAADEASGSADDAHSAAGTAQSQARISAQSAQQARRYAEQAGDEARKAVQEACEQGLFKGEQGESGVYVGSGDMPDGYNVQVDPNGEATMLIAGPQGEPGRDGGYYTPTVIQQSDDVVEFGFEPSDSTMARPDRVEISLPRGPRGLNGHTPVRGTDYWTEADKTAIVESVKSSFKTEAWTFTLGDGQTVTKAVYVE